MKSIIFDMDGVIINSEPIHFKIEKDLLEELGGQIDTDNQIRFVGTTDYYIWNELRREFNIDKSIEDIIRIKKERFLNAIKKGEVELVEGFFDFLKSIDRSKFKISIASSNNKIAIEKIINFFNLNSYIDFYISGDEVVKSKPNPEIFLKSANNLGIDPRDCIVIEDSKNGVKAAKLANMVCIGYKNLDSGDQDLSNADIVINNFNQLNERLLYELLDLNY